MIHFEEKIPTPEEYNSLTGQVGWGIRENNVVKETLNNALYNICAYDNNKIIRFGRII